MSLNVMLNDGDDDQPLGQAAGMQRHLLPHAEPQVPGFESYTYYRPAGKIGGDLFDFIALPPGRLAIALGDVMGKDVAAALMMAKFSTDLRHCIRTETAPERLAACLNDAVAQVGIEGMFVTSILGVLDLTSRQFRYCLAGHPPFFVRRADGRVEEHGREIHGFPLGLFADAVYQPASVELQPGDVVVLYSDGVTDARSPRQEMYDSPSHPRLRQRLALAAGGPEAIGRAVIHDIHEFSSGNAQYDDITLVCFGPVDSPRPA